MKKKIIIIAILILIILSVGVGVLLKMKSNKEEAASDEEEVQEVHKEKKSKKQSKEKESSEYINLGVFTVNLAKDDDSDRYFQGELSIEVPKSQKEDADKILKGNAAKITHEFILVLSEEKANALVSIEGKKTLAEKLKKVIQEISEKQGFKGEFGDLLFVTFIVQ